MITQSMNCIVLGDQTFLPKITNVNNIKLSINTSKIYKKDN